MGSRDSPCSTVRSPGWRLTSVRKKARPLIGSAQSGPFCVASWKAVSKFSSSSRTSGISSAAVALLASSSSSSLTFASSLAKSADASAPGLRSGCAASSRESKPDGIAEARSSLRCKDRRVASSLIASSMFGPTRLGPKAQICWATFAQSRPAPLHNSSSRPQNLSGVTVSSSSFASPSFATVSADSSRCAFRLSRCR